ncbi:MAG: hypothetical protein QM765_48000 [Myxococcales bacterium]
MAKPKPDAPQTLRQAAASLAVEPDGSFFFACGPGAYLNGSWNGFGRFDAASGKVAKVEAPFSGPIAHLGGDVVGLERKYEKDHFVYVLKRADRISGAVQAVFEPLELEVQGLAPSPNGGWIAAVGKGEVAVFDPSGKKVESRKAQAACFTGPDELLYATFATTARRDLATGRETPVDIKDKVSLHGVLRPRDGWVLSPRGEVLELSTGRARGSAAGRTAGASSPGPWCAPRSRGWSRCSSSTARSCTRSRGRGAGTSSRPGPPPAGTCSPPAPSSSATRWPERTRSRKSAPSASSRPPASR